MRVAFRKFRLMYAQVESIGERTMNFHIKNKKKTESELVNNNGLMHLSMNNYEIEPPINRKKKQSTRNKSKICSIGFPMQCRMSA